jgi:hypothetical protein
MAKTSPIPDMQPFSMDDINRLRFDSVDDALDFYKFAVRSIAMRTKSAFLSDLWAKLKGDLTIVNAMMATENGRKWIDIFTKAESVFLSFSQPVALANFGRIKTHLEVNVLPKQFETGIRGRIPIYVKGATALSYADTNTGADPRVRTVFNFGDLSDTAVGEDAERVMEYAKSLNLQASMGAVDPATLVLIGTIVKWVVVLVVSILAFILVHKALSSGEIPPELLEALRNAKPGEIKEILEQWRSSQSIFEQISGVLKWLAIAAGSIMIGGTVIYFVAKD